MFKNIPKEKFYLYEKNKSILLSPNAEGLTWNTSNPAIATVKNGIVTMKSSGSVLIQCIKNSKKTKVCRLYLYQKATKKYGIQKADFKTGNPRRKISVLGTLGETGIVTVVNKKKAAVASDKVLLYSNKANRDFFFKNWNDIFKGVHFLNQDTLEYNEKEATVFNIVDDTLYIHINVKFRGDGVYQEFTRKLFFNQEEKNMGNISD
ncbi:MAG: hypothetical protein J6D02_05520 [Lachnospira sp.]|nr:hypothetical protein [Lachnospira sp.]